LAQAHADKAISLGPDDPVGHDMQALLAMRKQAHNSAFNAAAKALNLGSTNPQTCMIAVMELWRQDAKVNAKDIAYLSRRAIGLWPRYKIAYQNLNAAIHSLDIPSEDDVKLMTLAHKLYEQDHDITLGLALALAKTGQSDSALEFLDAVLGAEATPRVQEQARGIFGFIVQKQYMPKIDALVRNNDFTAALAQLDQLRAAVGDEQLQNNLAEIRGGVELTASFRAAEKAVRAGKRNEAAALYRGIIARDGTPPSAKKAAQDALKRLRL